MILNALQKNRAIDKCTLLKRQGPSMQNINGNIKIILFRNLLGAKSKLYIGDFLRYQRDTEVQI